MSASRVIGSSQYTRIVYTRAVYLVERPLKNITLSAEESLIENARQKAQSQMEELSSVRTDGRTFTRDEMNER